MMKNQFRINSGSFYIRGKRYVPPDVIETEEDNLHIRFPGQITLLTEQQAADPEATEWGTTGWRPVKDSAGWHIERDTQAGVRRLNNIPLQEGEARGFQDDHRGDLKKFFRCPRIWAEGTEAFIIGGGPSLQGFDWRRLADRYVIACNDAFRAGDWDIMHYGDDRWFKLNYFNTSPRLKHFQGLKTTSNAAQLHVPDVKIFRRMDSGIHGLESRWELGWNQSTGASAINLAMILGATKIYLLGFDMHVQGKRNNWYANPLHKANQESCNKHRAGLERMIPMLPKGISITNLKTDPESPLDCFEIADPSIILPPASKVAKTAVSGEISPIEKTKSRSRRRRTL